MSATEYDYVNTDFANDIFSEDTLKQQIESDGSITVALSYIRSKENVELGVSEVYFGFVDELPAEDQVALGVLVAAHDGSPLVQVKFHASSTIVGGEHGITEADWAVIGGVVTTPSFFCPTVACLKARMVGSYNTDGGGAELRIVEDGTTILGGFVMSDSSQAWAQMQWFTTTAPSTGTHEYTIEARLNGATSAKVRFVSMSLLEFYA